MVNLEATNPAHEVATVLQAAAHVAHAKWPAVEEGDPAAYETVCQVATHVAGVLRYLAGGDPPRAAEQLRYVDDNFARIPNGDPDDR